MNYQVAIIKSIPIPIRDAKGEEVKSSCLVSAPRTQLHCTVYTCFTGEFVNKLNNVDDALRNR